MSLKRNAAPPGYHREAGHTADLIDPASAYIPGGASAPTTDPARAYSGKRATASTLAAVGAHIPGTEATSSAAEIVDPAGAYGGTGASAPTIDPAGAYSGSGAGTPTLATVGTYLPVAGSNSAAARVVDPAWAHSGAGARAAPIDPAGAHSAPGASAPGASAPALAPAGADIPVSEANSAVAEIVDPAGAYSPAGAGPATTDARADLGAGAPVLSPGGAYIPVSGTISAATEIRGPAGAPGPARAPVPTVDQPSKLSDLSASPAPDPNGAPPGYYYQAGATAYIEDPAGTFSLAGATTPTADPGGTYSGPGASAPITDPAGTYSSPYALDRLFLETASATPDNEVLSFNTLTALENYYGATSDEAALAAEFFTTYGSSANMLVVRFPLGGNRAHLYGANVSNLTLLQATNGSLSVTSQGYNYSASINLSDVTSPTLAATAIQAALNENLPVAAVTTGDSIAPVSVSFTGSTNGLLLDVTSISSGSIEIGALISGAGVPAGTQINSQITGAPGGVGLYGLYVPAGIISSETMTESYGELTVGSVSSGTVADGEQVTGAGILPDTAIEENLGGNTWLVDFAQTANENMTMTGAPLSVLYTAVTGATENSGCFSIQQNGYFNYDTASLTYATGSAAGALGLTQASGASLAALGGTITIASEAAFMSLVQTESDQFGSFQSTWSQLAEEDPEAQAALAEWAQSTDGQFQFLENATSTAPPAGISTATIDPAGTYSGPGASLPTPAAPGTYIPLPGQTSAAAELSDPVGTFSGAGASAYTLAQPGYYVGTTGASTETPAAAGTYIPFTGATSASQATVDPVGTFSGAGASAYTLAQTGYYVGTTGADTEMPAAAGTYIPFTGATSASQATVDQPGYYSLAGASAPTEAQPGYYVPTAGASSETPVSRGYYQPSYGATTEILAQLPVISGTVAGQTTAPLLSDTPFSSVTFGDPNTDTTDSLTIELSGGGGILSDGAGFDGLTTSAGVYTLSGTAAAITSELDALVFTPSASTTPTTFTLTDTSSAGTSASDANTTVTVEPTDPPVVSVSDFLANQATLDQTPGGFDILDTAAAITASLDQLDDPHINSITILDSGPVGPSVQQLTSDATAIGKLQNADSAPVLLAVNDTAANIEAGLTMLVADTGEIASITASDAPVVVSVATFLADQPTLDKIVGGFAISDTAADVAQNLDALRAALERTPIIPYHIRRP